MARNPGGAFQPASSSLVHESSDRWAAVLPAEARAETRPAPSRLPAKMTAQPQVSAARGSTVETRPGSKATRSDSDSSQAAASPRITLARARPRITRGARPRAPSERVTVAGRSGD